MTLADQHVEGMNPGVPPHALSYHIACTRHQDVPSPSTSLLTGAKQITGLTMHWMKYTNAKAINPATNHEDRSATIPPHTHSQATHVQIPKYQMVPDAAQQHAAWLSASATASLFSAQPKRTPKHSISKIPTATCASQQFSCMHICAACQHPCDCAGCDPHASQNN